MRGKSIHLEGITKTFGAATAVDDITLRIEAGELVALLGPSGCGKTTLLRIVAGLEEPNAGRLRIGDKVCHDATKGVSLAPGKRDIGLIFQSYALWPHLTVRENILFAPRAREAKEKFEQVLDDLKLTGLAERYPSQLSGGQQQRVAIGRMLAAKPSVFLMDEPLSNLDAALRFEMRQELRRIHDTQGATTLYVTHDQGEALAMADRVAVMDGGRIVQVGAPAEVYRRPATLQAARFLANPVVNILDAQVDGCDLQIGPLSLSVSSPPSCEGRAVVTARPEDVRIGEAEGGGMRVASVMPLGAEAIATLEGEDDALRILARVSWDRRPSVGEHLAVELPASAVNIYHPESGVRIGP